MIKKCKQCDKEYNVIPARKNSSFCSLPCYHISIKGKSFLPKTQFKKGQAGWNKGTGKACKKGICVSCSTEFTNKSPYRERMYCTKVCAGKATGFKTGNFSWTTGMSKKELKIYYSDGWKGLFKKGQTAPTKGIRYSKERIESMSGELSSRWKGGLTPYPKRMRNNRDYIDWRIAVFNRDKYTCQKCNQRGGTLHPHHKNSFSKYPEERFSPDNGATLCIDCHKQYHHDYGRIAEKEDFPLFLKTTLIDYSVA